MSDLHYFRKEWIQKSDQALTVDICIYGASSAGVIAAIEAAERGKTVALLQPGKFVGGLTAGGLGWTDHGKAHVIGGKSREFYRRVGQHYGKPEEWYFEPKVATAVYEDWLKSAGVTPLFGQYLDKVETTGGKITSITLLGGLKVSAKIFIDASYEGDLMAKAGVKYHVGREDNSVYGETINGAQVRNKHQFVPPVVDPYVKEGDPSSGLLPHIEPIDMNKIQGKGDTRVQAYNFRICMTNDPALIIPWEKPEKFNPIEYVLASRWFKVAEKDHFNEQLRTLKDGTLSTVVDKFDRFPNKTPGGYQKTDTNNHGPISSDYIGANWGWADGCYEDRERMFQEHVTYQKGYYWFMANDPSIPDRYRKAYSDWGLSKDEFQTTGGWSPQLYIREARRMVSDYVVTEGDTSYTRKCEDPVAMGSYQLDSHNCTRFVNADGKVQNDGDVQLPPKGPYGISYRSIVPSKGSIQNLFVPICCSTSHIAYGSVRMEPVFMILGESAAVAACMAIDSGIAVQDVKYGDLRPKLEAAKQVLEHK